MPYPALDEHGHVAPHDLPSQLPQRGRSLQQPGVLSGCQSFRIALAHIDHFAARPHKEFAHVRLASATTNRFVSQNPRFIDAHSALRDEEPFALANIGLVLATVPILGTNAQLILQSSNASGLKGVLCLANGGGIARDGRHKPSALVVTAQEPLLLR